VGSGGDPAAGGTQTGGAENFDAPFFLGADISGLQENIDQGATFRDTDGQQKDILELLKSHGFNYIRLRTFVDPTAPYGYASSSNGCSGKSEAYNDQAHIIARGAEVKAADMGFLLDFHYSDVWADPGNQIIPEAWRDIPTIEGLAEAVKTYTKDFITAAIAAGARPDMVQVGNEITPGMLVHVPGSNTDCWGNNPTNHTPNGSSSNWDDLAVLLQAGIAGVREVDSDIQVMLHIENTDDLQGVRNWVNSASSHGVEFDVLGLSCYEAFQGPPSTWASTFGAIAEEHPELSFVVAEYNPQRTAAQQVMLDLPDGRGLGTFFWEPTQGGEWGEAMFTWQGNVLEANSADFAEFDDTIRSLVGL
jgi:arabinogalactan endo-1,4-beta-galactosidase